MPVPLNQLSTLSHTEIEGSVPDQGNEMMTVTAGFIGDNVLQNKIAPLSLLKKAKTFIIISVSS